MVRRTRVGWVGETWDLVDPMVGQFFTTRNEKRYSVPNWVEMIQQLESGFAGRGAQKGEGKDRRAEHCVPSA